MRSMKYLDPQPCPEGEYNAILERVNTNFLVYRITAGPEEGRLLFVRAPHIIQTKLKVTHRIVPDMNMLTYDAIQVKDTPA